MAVLFAIFGAALNTGNDLVYRRSALGYNTGSVITFYFFAALACVVIGGPAALIRSGALASGAAEILFGAALGIVSFGAYLFFLLSLSGGSASIGVTIFRLNMIPAILLARIVLNERIDPARGIGIVFCVISIYLLAGSGKKESKLAAKYIMLSVGACLLGGATTFMNKLAVQAGHESLHLLFWRFIAVALIGAGLLTGMRKWQPRREHAKYAPLSGFFMYSSIFFILEALARGDLSLVMPITQLSFVFVTVISWIFFGELITVRKAAGSLLAVLAVILIT